MSYRVFISCGQRTEDEMRVGRELHRVLTEGGHAPFFAGRVHSFDELATHIFAGLARCEAYLAVMHPRGEVHYPGGHQFEVRGSVWIHQELAVLAYRRFLEGRSLPLRVLMHTSIRREGVLDNLIVNPVTFQTEADIYDSVREWMENELVPDPIQTSRERLFRQHTQNLDDHHWRLLLLCVRHRSTDGRADRDQVIRDFEALGGNRPAYGGIENALVVRGILEGPFPDEDRRSTRQFIAIRPAWLDLVIARLRERGELLPPGA